MTPPTENSSDRALRLRREVDGEWSEYRRLVISEMDRMNATLEAIRKELALAKTDIALLQLKSGAWGAIAGAVVAIGTVLLRYVGG